MRDMENKKPRESKITEKAKENRGKQCGTTISQLVIQASSIPAEERPPSPWTSLSLNNYSSSAHQCKQPDRRLPTPGILFRSFSDPAFSLPLQLSTGAVGSLPPRSCVQAVRDRIRWSDTPASSLLWEGNFGKCVFHWLPQLIEHD